MPIRRGFELHADFIDQIHGQQCGGKLVILVEDMLRPGCRFNSITYAAASPATS